MRTEEEIIRDLESYIKSRKQNRPNVLASIKKSARTQRIIDLIFSNPDTFKLENEIKNVPSELLTNEILIKFVLAKPKHISLLDESVLRTPVLVAFEFAKRRYEHFSRMLWNKYAESLKTPDIYKQYRDDIWALCDTLPSKYNDEVSEEKEREYIEKVTKEILELCRPVDALTKSEHNYEIKYKSIDFDLEKKLYIFISGYPDAGKTN